MGEVFTVGVWYPLDNNASLAARARFMVLARLARDPCAPSSSGFWRGCGWAMVTRLGGSQCSYPVRCRDHVYHMGILADDLSVGRRFAEMNSNQLETVGVMSERNSDIPTYDKLNKAREDKTYTFT